MDDFDFKRMVHYFQEEKGDPTRSTAWNEERCKKLMPLFYECWKKKEYYEKMMYLALEKEA
jgi:hypothetical protein